MQSRHCAFSSSVSGYQARQTIFVLSGENHGPPLYPVREPAQVRPVSVHEINVEVPVTLRSEHDLFAIG